MSIKAVNIEELIENLQIILKEEGNLPIMGEYDASYFIGRSIEVRDEKDPDDYDLTIRVLFIH